LLDGDAAAKWFCRRSKLSLGKKRVASGVSLLGLSLLLSAAVGEVVLRLVPSLLPFDVRESLQAKSEDYGVSHPYIGYLHKPLTTGVISGIDFRAVHHTDGFGFRNPWPWPTKADIVALGDSLVFGYGVEDDQAWPAILARSLPHNRIMNFGLIGAGPQQYLRIYETFGTKLHPKLVLVGAFMANDFWDASMFDRWLNSGVGGNFMVWNARGRFEFNWKHPLGGIKGELKLHSYLFNLLQAGHNLWQWGKPRTLFFANGARLQVSPNRLDGAAIIARPERREFRLALDAFESIQRIALKQGSHVVVVFQPSKEQVYLPLLGLDPPDPSHGLSEALGKQGIDFLDLTPAFREHAKRGECLFYEQDGHPNVRGYALIAELLASHIKENTNKYGLEIASKS
jgi:lysophospholipase L1-like esterase